MYEGYKLPAGDETPEVVIDVELAERFKLDPRIVEGWSAFHKNRYLTVIELKNQGMEYRRQVDEFMHRPR